MVIRARKAGMVFKLETVALRVFLFACFTGLRISDSKAIRWSNINGNFLEFTPVKTADIDGQMRIPFPEKARAWLVTKAMMERFWKKES